MLAFLAMLASRVGGARLLALPMLRFLALVSGWVWILLTPGSPAAAVLEATMLAFLLYSVALAVGLWINPARMLGLNLWVLIVDLAFALTLVRLTGGARSTLFLALLLIAGLQSYYYNLRRGVLVALASGAGYLAVIWPTIEPRDWADIAIRLAVLAGTAIGGGVLADVEAAERSKVLALTGQAREREAFIGGVVDNLHELERSARQAEKMAAVGTLAAGVAHELNNPIGIISSRIELMLLDLPSAPEQAELRRDLETLHRHAQRVARIVQGLLSFARPAPAEQGPVDLNRVVEDTLLLVDKPVAKAGIAIVRRLGPALPAVWGDAHALQQVVMNLVTNACEALGPRGRIAIETEAGPDGVRLTVRDDGPGMTPETLAKIFDPFFTTKPSGTGLGLSITYGIIRDHHGTIAVDSEPGRGTSFALTFPPMAVAVSA